MMLHFNTINVYNAVNNAFTHLNYCSAWAVAFNDLSENGNYPVFLWEKCLDGSWTRRVDVPINSVEGKNLLWQRYVDRDEDYRESGVDELINAMFEEDEYGCYSDEWYDMVGASPLNWGYAPEVMRQALDLPNCDLNWSDWWQESINESSLYSDDDIAALGDVKIIKTAESENGVYVVGDVQSRDGDQYIVMRPENLDDYFNANKGVAGLYLTKEIQDKVTIQEDLVQNNNLFIAADGKQYADLELIKFDWWTSFHHLNYGELNYDYIDDSHNFFNLTVDGFRFFPAATDFENPEEIESEVARCLAITPDDLLYANKHNIRGDINLIFTYSPRTKKWRLSLKNGLQGCGADFNVVRREKNFREWTYGWVHQSIAMLKHPDFKRPSGKYYLDKNDFKEVEGKTVYRIVALKPLKGVKIGDKGGYIQSEYNLDQLGTAWIYDESVCMQGARVMNNGVVKGNSVVKGRAMVGAYMGAGWAMYGEVHSSIIDGDVVILGEVYNSHLYASTYVHKGEKVTEKNYGSDTEHDKYWCGVARRNTKYDLAMEKKFPGHLS